jgi:hypothetical protein
VWAVGVPGGSRKAWRSGSRRAGRDSEEVDARRERGPEHRERALVTFGHGTASRERLADLLRGAGVGSVVDVRTAPGSRRNPDVLRERLAEWLPDAGIAYRWEPALGGFRRVAPDSPDTFWRNDAFRGYAGYTRSPEFVAAMDALLHRMDAAADDGGTEAGERNAAADTEGPAAGRTAVMCSESVWWRCHRRLIADFALLARGVPVDHLMPDGRTVAHTPTAGVRLRDDGLLVYDAAPPD